MRENNSVTKYFKNSLSTIHFWNNKGQRASFRKSFLSIKVDLIQWMEPGYFWEEIHQHCAVDSVAVSVFADISFQFISNPKNKFILRLLSLDYVNKKSRNLNLFLQISVFQWQKERYWRELRRKADSSAALSFFHFLPTATFLINQIVAAAVVVRLKFEVKSLKTLRNNFSVCKAFIKRKGPTHDDNPQTVRENQ